jgi:ATP-dependent Zn protease
VSILKANLHVLHQVARTLLEKEVIDGAEIKRIVEGLAATSAEGLPTPQTGTPA